MDLRLNARIERPAGLGEHPDRIRDKARAKARQRGIVKGDAGEMRSADVGDLRPKARRGDRIVHEVDSAPGRQMRRDD